MIIGDDFIFFHMPRTGGTFITDYFTHSPLKTHWQVDAVYNDGKFITSAAHAGPLNLVKDDFLHERFWFAFIRNPFPWYVSKWASKFPEQDFKSFLLPLLNEENFLDVSKFVAHSIRYNPNLFPGATWCFDKEIPNQIVGWDFRTELNPLGVKFDIGFMTHRYLQVCCAYPFVYFEKWSDWIERHDELCLMDRVYEFEDGVADGLTDALKLTDEQMEELRQKPKANISEHKPYQEYYDDELRELVEYKDRFIFEAYGYTF